MKTGHLTTGRSFLIGTINRPVAATNILPSLSFIPSASDGGGLFGKMNMPNLDPVKPRSYSFNLLIN